MYHSKLFKCKNVQQRIWLRSYHINCHKPVRSDSFTTLTILHPIYVRFLQEANFKRLILIRAILHFLLYIYQIMIFLLHLHEYNYDYYNV